MSHIFDALQRSQSEDKGAEPSPAPAATELLERAERQAILQWISSGQHSSEIEHSGAPAAAARPAASPANGKPEHPAPVTAEDAEEAAETFSLVQTLKPARNVHERLVAVSESESPAAEAFRLLAVRLRHLRRERMLRRILITSTIPQEGKSLISANLASTLAAGSQKVLLVEGDLRRPSLMPLFGLEETPGMAEYLRGERSLAQSLYHLENPGLWILPAGNAPGNPLKLLQSAKLAALMDKLTRWFDWLILDSPPVMPLADTSIWARLADGILIVSRTGVTEQRQLQRGLDAIDTGKLLGAVLNSSVVEQSGYYYYRRSSGDGQPSAGGAD